MTPIGHFISATAVAGTTDVTTERETFAAFAYYALFLAVFWALTRAFPPGPWAMHVHDTFGNAALLFFAVAWSRKETRRRCFVCLLIGGQVLAAYTHAFDLLALKLTGSVPEGMWRPHNILHTPLAALLVPLVAAPLVRLLVGRIGYWRIYFYLSLGYFLHIFMDSITYDYQLYPLWPLSGFSLSLAGMIQRPDAVSAWLGNPLYVFSGPSQENVDGFIVYRSEPLINLSLMALYAVKCISRRALARA
jgi:hypothetical protein